VAPPGESQSPEALCNCNLQRENNFIEPNTWQIAVADLNLVDDAKIGQWW